MMVKICGITNLEDAAAAVEGGAGALGFNFYPPSPRSILPEDAARIAAQAPPGVLRVGVFVNEAPARIEEIARIAGLDVAQLHGDETPGVYPKGLPVWKALRVDATFTPALLDVPAEAVLLDGPAGLLYGGAGEAFDWNLARGLGRRIVIAGGLDASNVRAAIECARPWGVDACSRLESAPGRKDHTKLAAFLRAALETPC
ncbi:MAG: phosphoribosylanthranilate isomerase [Bryobacterales bacterium]|nr:phosphoribosylanthranilate isomerase [Bryobacterales bacterium]